MNFKKLLAIILSLMLIMSNSGMVVLAETVGDEGNEPFVAEEIASGERKTISITKGDTVMLKFIPDVTGLYSFTSISEQDTYGHLYDSNGKCIAEDDDTGESQNFYIEEDLDTGTVYYWGVRFLNDDQEGEVDVVLNCEEVYCAHENTTEEDGTEASCFSDGYTAGLQCTDCGAWKSGHKLIEAAHPDDDENDVCDLCKKPLQDMVEDTCGGYQLEEGNYDGSAKYYLYKDGTLDIYGKGTIENNYFSWRDDIRSVIIHDDITGIEWGAFWGCDNLSEVTIMNPDCWIYGDYDTFSYETMIIGHKGSTAEAYATEFERDFSVYCPHENVTESEATEPTCYAPGYTEGELCKDCGRWASGHAVIKGGHVDEEPEDLVCDKCEKTMPISEGTCGGYLLEDEIYDGSVKYYFYEDGTLEIYGEGELESWIFQNDDSIRKIIIGEKVSGIRWGSFCECYNIEEVTILNPDCSIEEHSEIFPYGTTIIGHTGSTAEVYAYEYYRKFLPYCEHKNTTEAVAVEATCYTFGYTPGELCSDCGRWASGHERIEVIHEDTDADGICDFCEGKMHVYAGPCGKDEFSEDEYSDFSGDPVRYYLYEDGTLEIYGEGRIGSGSFADDERIKRVILKEGVTGVGMDAFWGCWNLEEITILNPDCIVKWFSDTIPDETRTIIGKKNSTAEGYAEEHGRTFLEYCPHENAVEIPEVEAKCNAFGYTAGVFCEDCGRWVSGHEKNIISHRDRNENGLCDRCNGDMPVRSGSCGGYPSEEYDEHEPTVKYHFYEDGTLEIYGEGAIERWAFEYDFDIEKVIIGEGITEIEKNAFEGCYHIKEITILNPDCKFPIFHEEFPMEATMIGYEGSTTQNYAEMFGNPFLKYCLHENVEFQEQVDVGCYTFGYTEGDFCEDCGRWASGHEKLMPAHCDEDENAFCDTCEKPMPVGQGNCGKLEYNYVEDEEEYGAYTDSVRYYKYADGTVEIFGEGEIERFAFQYDEDVKNVIIKDGVTGINSSAFSECYELESVIIPASVKNINLYAFASCDSLESIILEDDVEQIEWGTFENCYDVTFFVPENAENVIKHMQKKRYTYEFKPESLRIATPATKNFYEKDEDIDLSGLVIEAVYEDESTKRVRRGFTATDYDLSKAGVQSVTVAYGGAETTFDVTVLDEIALQYTKVSYDGKAKKPSVTIEGMEQGTDYTVSYEDNKSVGLASVYIHGEGDYSGTIQKHFAITPKAPGTMTTKLYGYDDVKVSWSKPTGADGYYVYYKKSTSSSYTLLKRTTATSVTAANLADGVKYDFKVVPYFKWDDDRYTSTQSKVSSIYTLKKMATPSVTKSGTNAKVSWKKINGASGYHVEQYKLQNGKYVKVAGYYTTDSYKTITAAKGATRYYQVRAYYKTADGTKIYGPWSDKKSYKRT